MRKENGRRILVIDDDPVYRELLSIALTGEGYGVMLAEHGQAAKEILEREDVQIIILDLLMPLMDGLRFLNWLRQDARIEVPTLVLTSMDSRELSVEALVAGATDVIVKPVSLPMLLKKISAVL